MLPSHGYQGFRSAPPPSGWFQMGDGWVLWWSGRQIAHVVPAKDGGVRVHLDARKMWETKDEWAASIGQAKRYAERWCAARLYPELPLREAVARLTDSTSIQPAPPLPGLPPAREQKLQAQRLKNAASKAAASAKDALGPRKLQSSQDKGRRS